MAEGNIWISGSKLYIERRDGVYEVEGVNEGTSTDPEGSLWIEADRIAYVDANRVKRTIPLLPQGNTSRPPGFFALHPHGFLWYATKDGKRLGMNHYDEASAYWSDHSNIKAGVIGGYTDIPEYVDYEDHTNHANNIHHDKLDYESYHLDSLLIFQHSNWSDVDEYNIGLSYTDKPLYNVTDYKNYDIRTPHSDTRHQDWSDNYDRQHGDVAYLNIPYSDYPDHSNRAYSDRAHSNISHADYADYDDSPYEDSPHTDNHSDYYDDFFGDDHLDYNDSTPHVNIPHTDWDDTYDRDHGDLIHLDSAHQDWPDIIDRDHSDVQHSNISHADHTDYDNVAHGNFYYVDAYHDDHSDIINETDYINHGNFGPYDHLDTSHENAPSGAWSDHHDRPHSNNLYVDLPHDDHSDKSYIGSQLHDDHNNYGHFDHNDSYMDIPSNTWEDHADLHSDTHYLDHAHGDHDNVTYGSDGRYSDHTNAPAFDEFKPTHQDTSHADIRGYTDVPYGDGGGHADEGIDQERVSYSDERSWPHGDYSDHSDMEHLDSPRKV